MRTGDSPLGRVGCMYGGCGLNFRFEVRRGWLHAGINWGGRGFYLARGDWWVGGLLG